MNIPSLPTRWRGISRNVILLGFVSFFTDVSSDMIVPLLPTFVTMLGLGTVFLGWQEGLADSVSGLLRLVSGWWSDRLRRKKPLVAGGYLLSTFVRPVMALAAAVGLLFAVKPPKKL